MATILEKLKTLAALPQSNAGPWLAGAEEGVAFLKDHLQGEYTVLYASLNAVYVHGVLVPEAALKDVDREELSREFVSPDASWIIEHVRVAANLIVSILSRRCAVLASDLRTERNWYLNARFPVARDRLQSRLAKSSCTRSICIT